MENDIAGSTTWTITAVHRADCTHQQWELSAMHEPLELLQQCVALPELHVGKLGVGVQMRICDAQLRRRRLDLPPPRSLQHLQYRHLNVTISTIGTIN